MKFKSQSQQNQLIEKITPQHLVVGIDIAQQRHVTRAVNFRIIALGRPFSFSNDKEDFQYLLQWIPTSCSSPTETIVGIEPTGYYWLNVSNWLSWRQFEVFLIDQLLIRGLNSGPSFSNKSNPCTDGRG